MTDAQENAPVTERQRFFSGVGHAITQWAYVDRALFEFCRFALAVNENKTAAVFYRSPNIGDHISLCDALMKLSLAGRDATMWKNIVKKLADLLPFRNHIAHGPPRGNITQNIAIAPDQTWITKNVTHHWSINEEPMQLLKKGNPFDIRLSDLQSHINSVSSLLDEMRKFLSHLQPDTKPPQQSTEPSTPRSSDSVHKKPRKGAAPERPPRSSRA